jgi:hypothetical protein
MATETTLDKINRLRALLESGVTSSSVDGETTSFDLESTRRELVRLERDYGTRRKRSRVITPMMGRR